MTDILMPQMGLSVTEGTIIGWRVSLGERVTCEQVVCDITTDKTDAEVLAPADGVVLEILARDGDVVAIGEPIGRMSNDAPTAAKGEAPADAPATVTPRVEEEHSALPATPVSVEVPQLVGAGAVPGVGTLSDGTDSVAVWRSRRAVAQMLSGAVIDAVGAADALLEHLPTRSQPAASPMARRRAKDLGIDLTSVRGTGRHGRVQIHDVLAASRSRVSAGTPRSASTQHVDSTAFPVGYEDVPHEIVTTSPHRRAISEHMRRSRMTSAHMTTEVDVDMTKVSRVRQMVNAEREASGLGRVSYLAFIAKAATLSLANFPDINATFQHERSIHWSEVNLGVAVDTPAGLVVPVIRSAERLDVGQLADRITSLAERARARKLVPDDLRAGTFTISNPGSVGAVSAPAIINQPQVAILGVPVIVKRPWVVTTEEDVDAISIRLILRLAVTFDHRAIDGADATRFLVEVGGGLETWEIGAYT
ncbi:MAG: dihydrolipoamide acetyltransferase family protein [Acidimicrobiales bacterium]